MQKFSCMISCIKMKFMSNIYKLNLMYPLVNDKTGGKTMNKKKKQRCRVLQITQQQTLKHPRLENVANTKTVKEVPRARKIERRWELGNNNNSQAYHNVLQKSLLTLHSINIFFFFPFEAVKKCAQCSALVITCPASSNRWLRVYFGSHFHFIIAFSFPSTGRLECAPFGHADEKMVILRVKIGKKYVREQRLLSTWRFPMNFSILYNFFPLFRNDFRIISS